VFSAAPHGASAELVRGALDAARGGGRRVHCVDLSADFRYPEAGQWERVYGDAHGAPELVADFLCALPEHVAGTPRPHVGHPGCFTTSFLLAAVPLLAAGLVEPRLSYVATTGSTGAGRALSQTTHHPERRSTLFAYQPLTHRHAPEMRGLAAAAAGLAAPPEVWFVPQAGPFARGIHGTLQAKLVSVAAGEEALGALARAYAGSPFVEVRETMPRLQDVVGSNRAHLGVAVRGDALAVCVAIDNLMKGAAGGGVQWMNRLCGLPEGAGLLAAGPGWL
jgi:N-acetyl-gamma-glutamyl-phosphate reductase